MGRKGKQLIRTDVKDPLRGRCNICGDAAGTVQSELLMVTPTLSRKPPRKAAWAANRTKSGAAAVKHWRVTNGWAMCSRVIARTLHRAHHVQRVVRLGSTHSAL